MRNVIIPVEGWILCRGKFSVGELEPGDEISGYDSYNRRVAFAKIVAIEKLPSAPKISVPINRFKTITLVADTVVLTPFGERSLANAKSQLVGYCYQNPKNILTRDIQTLIESKEPVEVVRLTWEGPEYIWMGGILVGEKVKGVTVDTIPEGIMVTI